MDSSLYSRLTSVELLTSAWCPFNCNYCYIPKTEALKAVHKGIEKRLKSGEAFDSIAESIGTNITHLGLWGTEPTLTLPIVEKKLNYIMDRFPKLEMVSFSTSLLQPDRIVSFVKALPIKCRVQVSVDGPFSDCNRAPGTAKRIEENVAILNDGLRDSNNLELRWKATLTDGNIREMVEHPNIIDEYESYFKGLYDIGKDINIVPNSHVPTLMVPGRYTVEDGVAFAKYLRLMHSKGYHTTYTGRLRRLQTYGGDISGKRYMFSCSGGDSNCGMSGNLHMCHRSFYCDIPEYVESLSTFDDSNWDVSNFNGGVLKLLRDRYIPHGIDARYLYVMRGYHDFWDFQISTTTTMVRQLVKAGQCEDMNGEYLRLFAYFIHTACSCPVEGLLNTGSVHLMNVSLLRMFGNGAFKELLSDLSG